MKESLSRITWGVLFGLFIVIAAAFSIGCGAFEEEDATFVAYNNSDDNVVALVNDGQERPISANRSIQFTARVPVPTRPFGSQTGPSSIDRVVDVSVAFRNLTTGKLTRPIMCQAGAKVVTHISYEVSFGYESTSCTASYGYGAAPEVLK